MSTTFVTRGTDYIKQAVEKDNEEQYEQALHLYSRGIEFLVTGMKYEKNKRVTDTIRAKIGKYLSRAEQIKTSLEIEAKAKAKAAKRKRTQKASDHTNASGGTSSDNEDSEDNKLKSALSEAIVMSRPNVQWSDVAGLEVAKSLLKEAVILPMRFPHIFVGKRRPWEGILLYGPPGTGKSYLAKAVASEANNSTFFSVSSSDLVSKYVGESEKLIKNLFSLARAKKPSIIFIDEIDSLASSRGGNSQDHTRRLKNEFLIQMSGVMGKDTKGVLVLGATNTPWDLDPAVRRRFKKRIYIPLPDKIARKRMFEIHIGNTPHSLNDFDFELLANKTDGFSGSDISAVVQDALMEPVRTILVATHFKKVYNYKEQDKENENENEKEHETKDLDIMMDNKSDNDNVNVNENEKEKENKNSNSNSEKDGLKEDNDSNDSNDMEFDSDNYVLMSCSPNDPNGVKMSLQKIPPKDHFRVMAEPLKLSHFLRVLQSAKPSVGKQDIWRQKEWTKQYGQEGR